MTNLFPDIWTDAQEARDMLVSMREVHGDRTMHVMGPDHAFFCGATSEELFTGIAWLRKFPGAFEDQPMCAGCLKAIERYENARSANGGQE